MPTPLEIHLTSDIAKAFITSEFLTDMKIDLKNLPLLIMRLQIQLNSHGMELDTEKFSELVNKDNDVGSVIKQCGELLNSSNADASGLVTLLPEYSKGSVDAARGEKPSLASKPKHETRNAVVRGVKNSLSMRGIVIDSDSDSIDSDYSDDEEAKRLFGLSSHETQPKSRSKLQRADKRESKATKPSKSSPQKTNASKKFKGAALNTMIFRTRGTRGNEDADTASQGSKTSRSIGSNNTGSKKKLARSSTMDTSQKPTVVSTSSQSSSRGNRPTRRTTIDANVDEDTGLRSSRSSSRGKKPAKLMRSSTMDDCSIDSKGMAKRKGSAPPSRRTQDDEFSTGSSRMPRDEAKPKTSGLRRSVTDIALSSRGSSIGSRNSKGSSSRTSMSKRQGSSLRSSFRSNKKSEGAELSRDSSSRRRRVREGSL